jgi:hypothetical protein
MRPPTGRQNQDDVPRGVSVQRQSGKVNFCFRFDNEEGVGVRVAGGAEFLADVIEGAG